ncbi:sensor histidine kinase [Streptomyces pacificus]|uniref:ATP-binding protein n=1 Tax=Streptomyces pacificus TaxID=2705029 RepID=A0A6A0AZH5_9ACTN|nr:ATP-binding protein [Streptomyces pacificus]GFH38370.1 ATP-binding protein [Streptomyces pacificus]
MAGGAQDRGREARAGPAARSVADTRVRAAARTQMLVRLLIVVLLVLQLLLFPPRGNAAACGILVSGYALWALYLVYTAWRGTGGLPRTWYLLLLDLVVLGTLLALSGGFATPPGIRPLVDDAFFLVPVLAVFQPSARVTAAMTAAAGSAYLVAAGGQGSGDGWGRVVLHVLGLFLLGAVCTALTWVQQERVRTVGALLDRSHDLLGQAIGAEERERGKLAEALHDDALQDVLAARQDLDEARGTGRRDSLERADRALERAARRMRSIVGELHPAALRRLGLTGAVRGLAEGAGQRGGFGVTVECSPVPPFADESIVFAAARELLGNVVKHASASEVRVGLEVGEGRLRLVVADDGRGLPPRAETESLRGGHIGLASLRVRVETAGGSLRLEPGEPSGTTAVVELPLEPPSRRHER